MQEALNMVSMRLPAHRPAVPGVSLHIFQRQVWGLIPLAKFSDKLCASPSCTCDEVP